MTMPPRPHRKRFWAIWRSRLPLLAVLLIATWLRLDGVGFGLPALNDPDEPLFMMTALDMLRNHTFDPGWFGHPGTITLYCLALVIMAVGALGTLTGRFDGADGFAAAVFADPSIVFLPARLFVVACGVGCVLLTYMIARRLWGQRPALLAAAILAANALHIEYSQIIRTDMQASAFMLLCALQSLAVVEHGRRRDYAIAGLMVGLGCATKWPAAAIALSPICVGLSRREFPKLALFVAAATAGLFVASPFLLIDHAAVLRDLAGETRAVHPGATGNGLLGNLMAYADGPLLASFGLAELALAAIGVAGACRDRRWLLAVVPGFALFALLISGQHLVWDRWLVPMLPFVALSAAWTLERIVVWLAPRLRVGESWVAGAALALLLIPMIGEARTMAAERRNDTRQAASAWIRAQVPPGSTILLEHGAMDLLGGPWTLRFPLGSAGCIDPRKALAGQISADQVERRRVGRAIVDLGHVDRAQLGSCRADFAVLSHFARYQAEPETYAEPLQRYRELTADGVLVARIEPRPGERGGPVILIFRFGDARTKAQARAVARH
ncbi:MAG TPA: glycosyltransferase family 39 protein [Croceibacterium sp.]|nr:glycosyltransferase family 39 protein [Croceibacterium sp.]